jgi:hypothetical protein
MLSIAVAALASLAGVLVFFRDQLGLSNVAGRVFWLFVAEAFVLTALMRWVWSGLNLPPVKTRIYWVAAPALVLLALLKVNQVANPPQALPHLQAQIEGVVFADLTQDGDTKLLVVPVVSIRNTGEASIAERFDLTIHLPDGNTFHGDGQTMPERLEIPFPDGSALVVFGEDSLYKRTIRPIQHGGTARGRLAYLFTSLRSAQLKAEGVFCQLTMLDGWGQSYATRLTTTGPFVNSAAQTREIAGLRSEIRRPSR